MLFVSRINPFGTNNYQPYNKNNSVQRYGTVPGFSAKYNKNLNADTVSFKGSMTISADSIRELVKSASKRIEPRYNFTEQGIDEIVKRVTIKSFPFLIELLNLNNKKLPSEALTSVLDYINKDETDADEFREKLETFKDLKNIVNGRGFSKSILSDYFDLIGSQGIVDVLKSDILLEEPKHDYNSLQFAYNYAVKYYNDILKKSKLQDPEYSAKLMIKDGTFTSILALAQVFDKSALNELFYNRGKYIKSIYMPRFRVLNDNDVETLRKVQIQGVTDKENKGGDYATYELSLDDKIWTLNFLSVNRDIINSGEQGLDFNNYIKPVNIYNPDANFIVKFQDMKVDLMDEILRHVGVEGKVVDTYTDAWKKAYAEDQMLINNRKDFWDINYAHLLNAPKMSLLRHIILADTYGKFDKLLYGEGTIADRNRLNEKAFIKNNLDYEKWLKPDIEPITEQFMDNTGRKLKTFTVKNWDRCAKESLFDGNYTTCCTGIDKDQGESFPHYLTNTCTTTLETRNEKNKVIAMSRILMAKINGKVSMVIENIEVNNKMVKHYLYNDETKYKFREMIFDYARAFARNINKSDEEMPIYFCSNYYKVKDIEKGLEQGKRYEDVELIGEFPDQIYINAYGGRMDKNKISFADDGDGFALHLSNITKKAEPKIEDNAIADSDSNYNYADTRYFNGN